MNAKRRWYALMEAVCLATAVLWCLTAFQNNHPIYQQIGSDNGIFLCMGRGIADGLVPYVDITENKGPLFFLMMALPQMLVEGTAGIYVLEVLTFLGCCVLLMLCVRWLMGEKRHILCFAAAIMVLMKTCGQNNFCEEYDFFFMLLGFAVFVHAWTGRRRGAGARAFVLGVAAAAVALIKISDIPGLCVSILFYFIHAVRSGRKLWKEALGFVAGAAAVTVPVLIYLCAVGALGAMLQEYILNNFVHVATAKDADFWEIRGWLIFHDSYGWLSPQPVLGMAGAIALRLVIYRRDAQRMKRERFLAVYGLALAVANLLSAFVAGTGFHQHLLMGSCTTLIASLLAISAVMELLNRRVSWMKWPELAAAACLLAAIAVPAARALAPQRLAAVRAAAEEGHAAQCELLPYLEGYETVYTIGISPDWYWHTGLQPAFRYYNIIGFVSDNVGNGLEYEFEAFLEQGAVEALITKGDIERSRGILTNDTIEYVQNNYQVVVEDSSGRWLWTLI